MREVVVALTKRRSKYNLLSQTIRVIESTTFSHVNFIFSSKSGKFLIYEASGFTVKFNNLSIFLKNSETVEQYTLRLTEAQHQHFMDKCLDNLGKPYSIGGLIGMLFIRLFNFKRNIFADVSDSFFCSELVALILRDFYPDKLEQVNLETVGLKEIRYLLDNLPKNICNKTIGSEQ